MGQHKHLKNQETLREVDFSIFRNMSKVAPLTTEYCPGVVLKLRKLVDLGTKTTIFGGLWQICAKNFVFFQ